MITKEQALEFIYELSKKHQVCLDLSKGFLGVEPFNCINNDIDYKCITRGSTEIEELVEYFIKSYSVADEVDKVPVGIDNDNIEIIWDVCTLEYFDKLIKRAKNDISMAEEKFKQELQDYCKQQEKYIERLNFLKGML